MKKIVGNLLLIILFVLPYKAYSTKIPLNIGWKVQVGDNLYRISLPTTAVGVLMNNSAVKADLLNGLNYKQMDRAPFSRPWLFRNVFRIPEGKMKHVVLNLNGLNYSANVLVNGKRVLARSTANGPLHHYAIDITQWVQDYNELTIQVFPPVEGEPNIANTFHNPGAIDANMGIIGDVSVDYADEINIGNITVQSKLNAKMDEAAITLNVPLANFSDQPVSGALVGKLGKDYIYYAVKLKPGESRNVVLTPAQAPKLKVTNPTLWWCHNMGTPEFYDLSMEFDVDNRVCDKCNLTFGICDMKTYMESDGRTGIMLNGKKVQIAGTNWSNAIFIHDTPDTYESQMNALKDMNLNVVLFNNLLPGSDQLLTMCDAKGIIAIPVYKDFKTNAILSNADTHHPTFMAMHPSVLFVDNAAKMFSSIEATVPSLQLPMKETIADMLGKDNLWPVTNDYYNYHTSDGSVQESLEPLTNEINRKFGGISDIDDYLIKSDFLSYTAYRSAFGNARVKARGVIAGMLSPSWPSFCSQLLDYSNNPTAAYYGLKAVNTPQNIIYDGENVYVVNSKNTSKTMSALLTLYDANSKLLKQEKDTAVVMAPYTVKKLFTVSPSDGTFLLLSLRDVAKVNELFVDNAYYLPTDCKALRSLPEAKLQITAKSTYCNLYVELKNTSDKVSFFNRLTLRNGDKLYHGTSWSDNYITLQPGETRKVICQYKPMGAKDATLFVAGMNGKEQSIPVSLK